MANVCETKITVIGLQESADAFVKQLSKAMFGIDLDNLEPKQWGEDASVDGTTWYSSLVAQFASSGTRLNIAFCTPMSHMTGSV